MTQERRRVPTTEERFRTIAGAFTERVAQVPPDRWSNPSPCEGWTARDVVRHLVEWTTGFVGAFGVVVPPGPSVDDDPPGAWVNTRDAIQAALADPELAKAVREFPPGPTSFEDGVGDFIVGDILVHTWDLARAAGLDERLDPGEVHAAAQGIDGMDDSMMRASGHFGPRVDVPADADEQTRVLAFFGRRVSR
jgi:uncharacterized protein (TIGR03086 family)